MLAQSPDGDDGDQGETPPAGDDGGRRVEQGSDFYGVNFIAPRDPWMALAWDAGTRVVRWQFSWRDHETSPGRYNWTTADQAIRAWRDAGFKIHAILHNPPDYALANPGGLMPTGIDLPWDHPDNHWGRYCNQFARRYRGQIDSYEVWNEPDLDIYWEGTSKDYYFLLRTCYQGIKAADPDVPVSMAGMALLIEPNFFPEVVRFAAYDAVGPEHNYFFDVVSIHMYSSPQLAYDLTNQTRSVLESFGIGDKPIWITEVGVALQGYGDAPDTAQWGYATEDEAAWYLIATVGDALAAGAERLMWFRLADDDMDQAYGLLSGNGTPRPSYEAWQLASTLIHDVVEVNRETRNGVVIDDMRRSDGARVVVMYSLTGAGRNIKIGAELPLAVVINAVGGYFTVEPDEAGEYAVYVPEARGRNLDALYNYSVGGPPLILLEYDQTPPTATVEPVPIEGDKKHILLRWRGDDGPYGTGVASYDVEVSRDGGKVWEAWQQGTVENEAVFDVSEGGIFLFRARATDRSGNLGTFSQHVAYENKLVGTLIAQIIDLRGQRVPFARVELADGTLHDADEEGWVQVEVPPGEARVKQVDGSAQGVAQPPPVEIALGEELQVTWMLSPRDNLIGNGAFERGLQGWTWSSLHDVQTARSDVSEQGMVLLLSGYRRPWGAPAASVSLNVPPGVTEGVFSFCYRITDVGGQMLRVRAITADSQRILWQTNTFASEFSRVWVDMSQYAGRRVTLRFELWGLKGAPGGVAEIDDVVFGNVPVLGTGQ